MTDQFEDSGSAFYYASRDIQQAIESVTGNEPPTEQQNGEQPINGLSLGDPSGTPQNQANPAQGRYQWVPVANFWVNVGLFIATALAFSAAWRYANIADHQKETMNGQWKTLNGQWTTLRHQWGTMNKTLLEMQKQTPGVISGATTAARSLEASTRPWLVIDNASIPAHEVLLFDPRVITTTLRLDVKNIGHSPATNLSTHAMLIYGAVPGQITKGICEGNGAPMPDSGLGEIIFPDRPGHPVEYQTYLPPSDVLRYWKEQTTDHVSALTAAGCIAYRSLMSKGLYYTGFEYEILLFSFPYPTGPAPRFDIKIPGDKVILQPSDFGVVVK